VGRGCPFVLLYWGPIRRTDPETKRCLLSSRVRWTVNGANALMLRPPTFQPAGPDQVAAYFGGVSDRAGIPIFIQDTPQTPVSGSLARRLGEECERVRHFKVESQPPAFQADNLIVE
jgi:hypothetical protein